MLTCEAHDKSMTITASGFENGRVQFTQKPFVYNYFAHVGVVTSISFGIINDHPYFISTGVDGKLILWYLFNKDWNSAILQRSNVPLSSAAFSCDSSLIVYSNQRNRMIVIDINKKSFERNDHMYQNFTQRKREIEINQESKEPPGINQITFVSNLPSKYYPKKCQNGVGYLVAISSTGRLRVFEYDDSNNFSSVNGQPLIHFSNSFVKGISAADRYIAGICFDNIVRVFDFKMMALLEIRSPLPTEETNNDVFFINDNPIYSLYWKDPDMRLVICTQEPYKTSPEEFIFYTIPRIVTKEYQYQKNTMGFWEKV